MGRAHLGGSGLREDRDNAQAPPSRERERTGARGRSSAERLILSTIRRRAAIPSVEIAQELGISAQTVSTAVRTLEADGLILRGEPVRGRIGQPSVPLSLDPDGALFLGAKIGRRSADIVLADFTGQVRARRRKAYDFPTPAEAVDFLCGGAADLEAELGERASRLAGLGIAIPSRLWDWIEEIAAPEAWMTAWRDHDMERAVAARARWPVYVVNDGTAACAAERVFGDHGAIEDLVYFYIGTFVGGGLVVRGTLLRGGAGDAGAVASMLVPDGKGGAQQLLNRASLIQLERALSGDAGDVPDWERAESWTRDHASVQRWIDAAGRALAHASLNAAALTEARAAIIDGPFPRPVHENLLAAVKRHLAALPSVGITRPAILRGSIGPLSRALGGASLPLFDVFETPGAIAPPGPARST